MSTFRWEALIALYRSYKRSLFIQFRINNGNLHVIESKAGFHTIVVFLVTLDKKYTDFVELRINRTI